MGIECKKKIDFYIPLLIAIAEIIPEESPLADLFEGTIITKKPLIINNFQPFTPSYMLRGAWICYN